MYVFISLKTNSTRTNICQIWSPKNLSHSFSCLIILPHLFFRFVWVFLIQLQLYLSPWNPQISKPQRDLLTRTFPEFKAKMLWAIQVSRPAVVKPRFTLLVFQKVVEPILNSSYRWKAKSYVCMREEWHILVTRKLVFL